jgi:plasmid stabilization system protein ParE
MTRPIRWTTRAATQLQEAATYLESARSGTGLPFVDQVEAILQVASNHPEIFPRAPRVEGNQVRRGLVRRYGYWIIYEIRQNDLLVLSIWHGAREPEGWRET